MPLGRTEPLGKALPNRLTYKSGLPTGLCLKAFAETIMVLLAVHSVGALAQDVRSVPQVARPVVQALPSSDAIRLNEALTRLGQNPRDVDALVDAGEAARSMGDFEAAIGFYKRAQQISSGNPGVLGGLASAYTLSGDPYAAIPLFAEAERAGASPLSLAEVRGLAYDLVGDNASAQRFYRLILTQQQDNDEVLRKLALSMAISGDGVGAETALLPLLRKQDKAAWRARVFALAIDGKPAEAVKLSNSMLPKELAEGMAPYLRYMARLTRAQQAAAANLGQFPRASEIGRDDPRVANFSNAAKAGAGVAAVDSALVPRGEPLGAKPNATTWVRNESRRAEEKRERKKANRASAAPEREPPPEPKPARSSNDGAEPPAYQAAKPDFNLAQVAASQEARSRSAAGPPQGASSEPGAAVPAQRTESFSNLFGDFGKPKADSSPASGAVDLTKIEPAKPKVEKQESRPKPPSHPSRIWVQLGIGQNKSALSFDWRKLSRKYPDLFAGRKAHVSEMGRTNRMLAGPFETQKAANEFVSELERAGMNGPYVWTSPAGQVVDGL